MAEICCGLVSEKQASPPVDSSSRAARRRRMEIRRFKYVAGVIPPPEVAGRGHKRTKSKTGDCDNAVESCLSDEARSGAKSTAAALSLPSSTADSGASGELPKFGFVAVCGRRRDMEDALAIYPSFSGRKDEASSEMHYYGVYDGHGCSHVATKCRERLHELVREEMAETNACSPEDTTEWKAAMERSFIRMDEEVTASNECCLVGASCRCELQSPECDAVGSTAVVAVVTPDKIIVANCGDSRAVLCRNGKAIPLSSDHKPDRPDELSRIEAAGGRVIYWDGPRVLGVLAMSRAIGDNYLKPYVSCEPEVMVVDRTEEDDCLILASDGLWDVVSNETACGVARMCLRGKAQALPVAGVGCQSPAREVSVGEGVTSDKACTHASMLLSKLALARRTTDNVSVVVVDLRRDT